MKKWNLLLAGAVVIAAFAKFATPAATFPTGGEKDSAWEKLSDAEKRMPQNAILGLQVADGLQATLFASEPMMGNPTNIDVDARGRVWVCEAYNYRPQLNPDNPQRSEGDRILILEDKNGDGRADDSKVFYQGTDVNAALGVAVLGNKVIVSCSPNVFVFTDTDGDDKADKKEILFSHVGGEQHDHAVHSFSFGPDGKLYFNFGNAGEQLKDKSGQPLKDKDGKIINAEGAPYRQGMVFRMNPDGSEIEVLAHNFRNNYEAAIDAFGTIWQSDNDDDGNQGVRINYVMEYGNYGYTDEMTGAGWRAQRTGMEAEIPKRHWHQNDPGSIPNLLFTGAGSPTGMVIYEGTLLPEAYRNGMIHCDAGPNVVRAYPVTNDGAGYKATIKNILEGTRDKWFRPSDVCIAPDGSLLVADWYDPGVGGHQMGDMNRGRIYRVAPPATPYTAPAQDMSTAEGAVIALQNPNMATRYLAWQKLQALGAAAEPALQALYKNGQDPRMQARAFWMLAKMPGKGNSYIEDALKSPISDMRIAALRAARQNGGDIIPAVRQLVRDAEPQVRREAAIALRHNKAPEAAALWTELALQYDGKDRWYLEALGIGANEQWDRFLGEWKAKAAAQVNTAAGRDIAWRARSGAALPILSAAISDDATGKETRLKFFRAFDFIQDPAKENVLLSLLENNGPNSGAIIATALNHLDPSVLSRSPQVKAALNKTLASQKGTQEFVNLATRYKVKDQNAELLQITLSNPNTSLGVEAANLLLNSGGEPLLRKVIVGADKQKAMAGIAALSRAGSKGAMQALENIMKDATIKPELRKEAVRQLAGGWMESEYLVGMIKGGRLPKDLQPAAAAALSTTYRKDMRQEALKYLGGTKAKEGSLPPISVLSQEKGDAALGKKVYSTFCASCHKAGNEGAAFGPALSQIGSKLPKEALYMAILHPDHGISFGYEGYVFNLKDGNTAAGIISSETKTEVEVVLPGGIKNRYPKNTIASRTQMKNSMMPSGLQGAMSKKELVSLVEYLASLKAEKGVTMK
jgi:putative membrane-bound dehydrogenase-like protein